MCDGHPFKHLEPQLQGIRELWLAGEKRGSVELSELIEKVTPFIKLAAARILGSPRLRHFRRSADEAVQQFWVVMLTAGFKQYDPDRGPLFPYAYTTLSRICARGTKGPRGKLPLPLIYDQADRSKPLKRSGIKEELGMTLYIAVRELPFNYRRAILLKHWFEKEAKDGAARCAISVAKYNIWVFQGRKKLEKHFDGQKWSEVA